MLCLVDANDAFTKKVVALLKWPLHQDGAVLLVDVPEDWVEYVMGEGWSEAGFPPGQRVLFALPNPQGGFSLGINTSIKT